MKESWKGVLVIAAVAVLVPWHLADFDVAALGFWFRLASALILAALIVSPLVTLIKRRFGGLLAGLVAFLVLPELVLFLHFILFPPIIEIFVR